MALFTYETKKDTRSGFGAGMEYLSQHNPKVVALCADLIGSLKLEGFIKNSPERVQNIRGRECVLGGWVGG
jgi:transketolase